MAQLGAARRFKTQLALPTPPSTFFKNATPRFLLGCSWLFLLGLIGLAYVKNVKDAKNVKGAPGFPEGLLSVQPRYPRRPGNPQYRPEQYPSAMKRANAIWAVRLADRIHKYLLCPASPLPAFVLGGA